MCVDAICLKGPMLLHFAAEFRSRARCTLGIGQDRTQQQVLWPVHHRDTLDLVLRCSLAVVHEDERAPAWQVDGELLKNLP